MRRSLEELEDGTSIDTTWNGRLTTVTIAGNGVKSKRHALQYVGDVYDPQLGRELAYFRALSSWSRKRERQLLASTRSA